MKVRDQHNWTVYLLPFVGIILVALTVWWSSLYSKADHRTKLELYVDSLKVFPSIPMTFLKRYDTLNDENLADFIDSWSRWSDEMIGTSSEESHFSELFRSAFSWYRDGEIIDSSKFIVLPSYVTVFHFSAGYQIGQDTQWDIADKYSDSFEFGETFIPNPKEPRERLLFITPEIRRLLSVYLGGTNEEENGDRFGETISPVDERRAALIREYIPARQAHWGGYWHFETMPIVFGICSFPNCVTIDLRTDYNSAATLLFQGSETPEEIFRIIE